MEYEKVIKWHFKLKGNRLELIELLFTSKYYRVELQAKYGIGNRKVFFWMGTEWDTVIE